MVLPFGATFVGATMALTRQHGGQRLSLDGVSRREEGPQASSQTSAPTRARIN
jgi:hypothetical protein